MKLAIIHFLPLEYYPPITNLLSYLVGHHSEKFQKVLVYTTHNTKDRQPYKLPGNASSTTIHRTPFPSENENSVQRIIKYIQFNLFTLLSLILLRPDKIMYFESYSAWPVFFYTRYINRKTQILIHNHEYSSKEWYRSTMKQVRYFHILEKQWLYPRAIWNSQTNPDRLQLFFNDHPYLSEATLKVMPNYPPAIWQDNVDFSPSRKNPLKLVYVGSLSFQNTYLQELCEWIMAQHGNIHLDIFSFNLHENVKNYLNQLNCNSINFHEKGIEYNNLPKILPNYDVGLIIYKAYSENVTNCVSNKFYEYIASGLDVWFSTVMETTHQHTTLNSYPKVIPVDFENLEKFNWQEATGHEGLEHKPTSYFCEDVYGELVDFMKA